MWKIFHHSSHVNSLFRQAAISKPWFVQPNQSFNRTLLRSQFNKSLHCQPNTVKPVYTFSNLAKIGLGLASGTLVKLSYHRWILCQEKSTRLAGYRIYSAKNLKFDWRKFWAYLWPHIWYFIAAIAGALVVALLNIQIPQVMGEVINVVAKFHESTKFLEEIKLPALRLSAMYVAQSLFTFCYIYLLSIIGENVACHMKTDLFNSIMKQDITFFDQHRSGEIMNRLTTDIQNFKSSFKQCVSQGLRSGAQIVGCGISLIIISPQMTFVTLLCVPSVIGIGTVVGAFLRKLSKRSQDQVEKAIAVADEAVSNVRTVRAFAMENQEYSLYWTISSWYKFILKWNDFNNVRGLTSGARVFEYINLKPGMTLHGAGTIPYHSLKGNIEFENVTFSYPTRPETVILKDFNLMIPAGKTVAIVGSSGNGKSTVVALLERFYDINNGTIKLDGEDIEFLDPSWLRGRVLGLISQEPVLFGTTVRENIRYGRPDASDFEVEEAARLANAHDFIRGFPMGYDTMVGERGTSLSGGQKQRIAIARALLKNPAVLILDEATSALDTESEKVVQSALENARKGRTVLVIAHRLSTIQNADIIVVLNKGVIIETGTHDSLIRLKGHYWSLIQQQTKKSEFS
ncbi:uncharacterized protein CBL_04065 [Carabus blaptoides fortunei]